MAHKSENHFQNKIYYNQLFGWNQIPLKFKVLCYTQQAYLELSCEVVIKLKCNDERYLGLMQEQQTMGLADEFKFCMKLFYNHNNKASF